MDLRLEPFRWALVHWTIAAYLVVCSIVYLAGGLDPVAAMAG